jgi:macrolide-specific efflux system membrane fusion protein
MRVGLTLVALALASTTNGCFLLPKEERILAPPLVVPPPVAYRTLTADLDTLERRVTVGGTFVYRTQIALRFGERGGRLAALRTSLGDQVVVGQLLAMLDTDSLELDVARQQIRVQRAQLVVDRLVAARADRFQVGIAALDVDLEALALDQLRTELRKAQLRSPIAGEVVYIGRVVPGEEVGARQTIVQVADPGDLLLAHRGRRSDEFKLGIQVEVRAASVEYVGEVVMTPLNVPSDAPEDMRDLILIRVGAPLDAFRRGQTATVTLVAERREDVLVLPLDVVQSYANRRFVFILENGLRTDRTIETGMTTATHVEVVAGLQVGEQVVIR